MPRILTGPRLSLIAKCPCAAALQARGVEPAPPSEKMRRYWTRGQMFPWYAWQQLLERYDEADVERERDIPWQVNGLAGVGHADMYIRSEKQLWEVKSSVAPYSILDSAITQVKLYLMFDEEADNAVVYVINPSDLEREDLIPVRLTDRDRPELTTLLEQVAVGAAGGPLPPCSEGSPSACRHTGCQWYEHAWADYVAPPAAVLQPTKELLVKLDYWRRLKDREAEAKTWHDERKKLEGSLIEDGVPVGESQVGDYLIRRTVVKGRTTFSYSTADKAGALDGLEELLRPFVRVGEPSERFDVVMS